MPHVLSELEGVKKAVFKTRREDGEDGRAHNEQVFEQFEHGRARPPDAEPSTRRSCAIP